MLAFLAFAAACALQLLYMFKVHRERVRKESVDTEDIQLQIQIAQEKLVAHESELREMAGQVRGEAARLSGVRVHVRRLLAADDGLRHALGEAWPAAPWLCDPEHCGDASKEDDEEPKSVKSSLLEEMKANSPEASDINSIKPATVESTPSINDSVYSSLNDGDAKQSRLKCVSVTKLYKVSYLCQYIKQKKIRRATQHALLKKKIESIKKLLESWQESLNMVINNKLLVNSSHSLDAVSEDAMGDYSKCNVRESNSDTSLNKNNVIHFDVRSFGWGQNIYTTLRHNYNNFCNYEGGVIKTMLPIESRHETGFECSGYPPSLPGGREYSPPSLPGGRECSPPVPPPPPSNILHILPEETSSQMDIQDNVNEDFIEHAIE